MSGSARVLIGTVFAQKLLELNREAWKEPPLRPTARMIRLLGEHRAAAGIVARTEHQLEQLGVKAEGSQGLVLHYRRRNRLQADWSKAQEVRRRALQKLKLNVMLQLLGPSEPKRLRAYLQQVRRQIERL